MRLEILMIAVATSMFAADIRPVEPTSLTVHEWGTFTSIAGDNGMALTWLPLDGPTDLPCFVHRFEFGAKADLRGTVRMETPVIYFYGPSTVTADVRVAFPNGFITEWYPQANRVASYFGSGIAPKGPDVREPRANEPDSIEWPEVQLIPSAPSSSFAFEFPSSRYYAARSTDAVPLMAAHEKEKFLFYRGVGKFQPPIAASVNDADQILVRNLGDDPIPNAILFENHDGKVAWREHGPIRSQVTFEPAQPAADATALKAEMERILVAQGLFPKEAKAMVATWSDSWFEEGTRVFYFLPAGAVDQVLPLEIKPATAQTTRVFVGRMEVFTHATKKTITDALTRRDWPVIQKYGRFLDPIATSLGSGPWSELLAKIRTSYLGREAACGAKGW